VLAAFSCGRSTAVILDSGLKQTTATPVHDGFALQKCIIKHDIGGAFLTNELLNIIEKDKKVEVLPRFAFKKKLFNNAGQEGFELQRLDTSGVHPSYYQWCKEEIVRDVKEDVLYVSEEPVDDRSLETIRSQNYELPDGQTVSFQGERLTLTEKLFLPNDKLPSGGFSGLHHMIVESIGRADIDIRRDLFQNVVLSGGNTLYKGFLERL
jgi:actin-related protein